MREWSEGRDEETTTFRWMLWVEGKSSCAVLYVYKKRAVDGHERSLGLLHSEPSDKSRVSRCNAIAG